MAKKKAKSRMNGEGSFYFDKNKERYYGVVTVGYDADDKPIRKKVSDKDFATARRKFDELKEQVRKGTYVDKDKTKLEDIISFQLERDRSLNLLKDSSYAARKEILKVIQKSAIAKTPIQIIDDATILIFFNGITGYSQSYIGKIYRCLNSAFKFAQSREIIYKNPLEQIRAPKSKKQTKKITALTIGEQQELLKILHNQERDNPYRYIFELMIYTGLRPGEVNALDIDKDINFDFKRITVRRTITRDLQGNSVIGDSPKTVNGHRSVIMTERVKKLLNEYISTRWQPNGDNLLFYNFKSGHLLTTNQVNASFCRLIEKYNIIPTVSELHPLSEKNKRKIAYRKYTFYKKELDGSYTLLAQTPPNDWARNFGKYYYKKKTPERPYNLHMLRHTFATRCIESGMPAKVLQKLLGHADIQTTLNTYCDVFEEYENKAVRKAEEYMNKLLDAV